MVGHHGTLGGCSVEMGLEGEVKEGGRALQCWSRRLFWKLLSVAAVFRVSEKVCLGKYLGIFWGSLLARDLQQNGLHDLVLAEGSRQGFPFSGFYKS